jgi:hypothetical protein
METLDKTKSKSVMQGPERVTIPSSQSPLLRELLENKNHSSKEPSMPSESKACPKCGKLFKPAGLVGHLYHVHGIGKADLERISGGAAVDAVGAVKRIRDLSHALDDIRAERKALHDKDTSSSWSDRKDEPVKALLKSLDWAEGEIIKELKVLGVNFEDEKKKS